MPFIFQLVLLLLLPLAFAYLLSVAGLLIESLHSALKRLRGARRSRSSA